MRVTQREIEREDDRESERVTKNERGWESHRDRWRKVKERERVTEREEREGMDHRERERERERERGGGGILFIRCKCVQKFVGPDELFNPMAHYLSRFLCLSLYFFI